jgi:hypothetical protein
MTRIPVKTSTGTVLLKDIQIQFTVDNLGNTTMSPGFPKITPTPPPPISGFRAGTYKDFRGKKYFVTGPAPIAGGRVMWRIRQETVGANPEVYEASWASGAVAGHPFQPQLASRTITSTIYSWGVVGAFHPITTAHVFYPITVVNGVVGAQQIGNQLVIHAFWNGDHIEDGSATLTLCATTAC